MSFHGIALDQTAVIREVISEIIDLFGNLTTLQIIFGCKCLTFFNPTFANLHIIGVWTLIGLIKRFVQIVV